jgi:endonuclease/exonuclease/phosphatase (EEP) superfamily protein YafD
MTRRLRIATLLAVTLAPTALWLAGLWSSSAAVAHGLLLPPAMAVAAVVLVRALRARRRVAAIACLAVLCPGLALSAARAANAVSPADAPEESAVFELLSYNLLFSSRSDRSLAQLRETAADVLCLQEVNPAWAARLERDLAGRFPHRAVEPRPGAYGVAIYSRLPVRSPTLLRDGRRLAGQCVSIAPGGLETVLCNVHLSSPAGIVERGRRWLRGFDANARVRAAQWALLRAHVARAYPGVRRLVVAGDFNTLDTEPLYREIGGTLVDAFAAAGRGRGATFPTEPTAPFPLVRIDYVFASPELVPRAAEVLPPGGSDHRGLRVAYAVPRG